MVYPCSPSLRSPSLHSPSLRSLSMPGNEIAVCYRRASWARERAKHVNDPVLKQSLVDMERRWLARVHGDEFVERLTEIAD
jgi:hypothetical protein